MRGGTGLEGHKKPVIRSKNTYNEDPVHARHHQLIMQLRGCPSVPLRQVEAERIEQPEMSDLKVSFRLRCHDL